MEDCIYIKNDDGVEVKMRIYFTFDANDKHYVFVYEEGNDQDCFPLFYDEEGNMYPVEDEEEFEMCLEVFNSFGGFEDEE